MLIVNNRGILAFLIVEQLRLYVAVGPLWMRSRRVPMRIVGRRGGLWGDGSADGCVWLRWRVWHTVFSPLRV